MLSVVAAGREDDRPPLEALEVARTADRLGYDELWVGESGPTWDSFALAAAIARETERIAFSIGPIPVSVRDPASIGRGAASVAALAGGRPVGVALGTSSVRVVETFHGRCRAGAAGVLARSAEEVHRLITPGMTELGEEVIRGAHFRRRLPPGGGPLSVAAFGDRAIAVAARYADRMLLDLVSPAGARVPRTTRPGGRRGGPDTSVGCVAPGRGRSDGRGVRPDPDQRGRLPDGPRVDEAFIAAGYGEAVELAAAVRTPPGSSRRCRGRRPARSARSVTCAAVRARIEEYAAAGLDGIAINPVLDGDPAAERTLSALIGSDRCGR